MVQVPLSARRRISVFCIRDLADVTNGHLRLSTMPPLDGDLHLINRLVFDSRKVQPGDVFWALSGPQFDGAQFIEDALLRGATGIVVADRMLEPWAGGFCITVEDTRQALQELARWNCRRLLGEIILVLGDQSQRIAKALGDLLVTEVIPYGTPASFLGALSCIDEFSEFAVVSIANNDPGEIGTISHLCCPRIAVISPPTKTKNTRLHEINSPVHPHELKSVLPSGCSIFPTGDDEEVTAGTDEQAAQEMEINLASAVARALGLHSKRDVGSLAPVNVGRRPAA